MSEPIKYSDLIKDDGAIKDAIAQLELLLKTYEQLSDSVKAHARDIQSSLKTTSVATEEGRASTKKAADDTSRLEKAQRELAFVYSEVAVKVAELKAKIADKNNELKNEAIMVTSASTSYKEMKAELNLLIAEYQKLTREQALNSAEGKNLSNAILQLKAYVKQVDDAIKLETKTVKASSQANAQAKQSLTELEKAKRKLYFAVSDENEELIKYGIRIKEVNEITKLQVIIAREQEGSYNRLAAQYALNKIYLNKMSEAERTTTASGIALVKQTDEIYSSMIRLQEATGKHTLSVGNYKKAWDGVGMGVNQIVRELPVLGISLNTFFLGISNNVPILIDEIQKARVEIAAANAAGEKSVSITRRLMSAFFGWNTLLVVVMTVLAKYGRQLADYISSLFGVEKSLGKVTTAQEIYNKAMKDGQADAQKELVRLRLLYNATQDQNKSLETRLKAIKELRKIYPDQLKDLSDEQILAGKAAVAYNELAQAILKAAKSRAAEEQIVENQKEILKLNDQRIGLMAKTIIKEKELNQAQGAQTAAQNVVGSSTFAPQATAVIPTTKVTALTSQIEGYGKEIENTINKINELESANKRLAGEIDITDLDFNKDPKTKTTKTPKDRSEEIERANLEIRKKYIESITALETDELEKRKKAYEDAFESEKAALMNRYENDKDLTEESRGLILKIIQNWGLKLLEDTEDVNTEMALRELGIQAVKLQNMLEASKEGSLEEANIRLAIMENSKKQELLENSKLTDDLKQDELDIHRKWDNIIQTERNKAIYELSMMQFDQLQKLQASEFDLLRKSENDKTKFKLQQEKLRWQKILEFAKAGTLAMTDIEIKTIENLIKKIDQELSDNDKKIDFYSLFGLDPTDEERQAISDIIGETMSNIKDALESEIQLTELAIRKAEDKVAAKQSALDAEIEARNKGYAFNVTIAQKELDDEKKRLEAAEKQKAKLVAAQQKLDTVAQASSLVTASANIWSSLSPLGPLGIGLAIAGIATMFGSFAYAKVRANEVTKAQAKQYGEGGFETLEGGSHSSGNDINIGNMPDGRERRAEGGEGLAIISKSKMSKYKGLVPQVINAINKGVFEKMYSSTFSTDSNSNINIVNASLNTKALESDVKAIREQNERKVYVDGRGNTVVTYKNLKTIYKA